MRVLVGCPVSSREWIIESYMDFATFAVAQVTDDFEFVFLSGKDDPTNDLIVSSAERLRVGTTIIGTGEDARADVRAWNHDRYEHMADLRNQLLAHVRYEEPDIFLSLDSDMLMHPKQFESMMAHLSDYDAIGGKAYLSSSGRHCPTWGKFKKGTKGGAFTRHDAEYVFRVDVLMAIKAMTPAAYNVDYEATNVGEDIGWSLNAREQKLKLGWDGKFTTKHVMHPDRVDVVDDRCGY